MDSDKIDLKGLNSLTINNYEFQIDLIKQNPNLSKTQKYYLIKKFKALRKENWR